MNERVIQFRVGVVVVAATIITGIMIMLFGEGQALIRQRYTIYLLFPEAPGVAVDTPVTRHGVLIGRVSAVELLEGPQGGVRLTARIDADRHLRRNDVCRIATASLLGDAVLEFVRKEGPSELVQDGETIADGVVLSNPLEVISSLEENIGTAVVAIEGAANEVQQLARNINQAFGNGDPQFRRIMDKSEVALDQISGTLRTFDELIGDSELKDGLRQSIQDFPRLFQEFRETLGAARQTMEGIDGISVRAQRNLENLESFTAPLGERGDSLVREISASVENLNVISEQLVTFTQALNNRSGTLGRLIYDPEIYDSLNETVNNLNRLTRRIDPIMDDVRVFTDKIARDPRSLGIKGALDRKPLGVGIK